MLRGIKKYYERFHRVEITEQALQTAVEGAGRYLTDRFFPDKAIDLIDEAAARLKLQSSSTTSQSKMLQIERAIAESQQQKQNAILHEDFQNAQLWKEKEEQLVQELEALAQTQHQQETSPIGAISALEISEVLAMMTGIPLHQIEHAPTKKIAKIEPILNEHIIGQTKAIADISAVLKRHQAGLIDEHRPRASFLFLGPSGVGKTLCAKTIAQTVYGDAKALIQIDMSEFSESFTVSKLIGSPAGYVGYKEANKFTDLIRRRPYSVVLFDEIEKAHPEVRHILLQILDEGHISDATGKLIDFRHTIIILTSNIGINAFQKTAELGFSLTQPEHARALFENAKHDVIKSLKQTFAQEFLNRLDTIVVFEPLSKSALELIVQKEIDAVTKKIAKRGMRLQITEKAISLLAETGFSPDQGARGLHRTVQELIETPIANYLIAGKLKPRSVIRITTQKTNITVNIAP